MVIWEMFLYVSSSFLRRRTRIAPNSNSFNVQIHNLQSYRSGNSEGYHGSGDKDCAGGNLYSPLPPGDETRTKLPALTILVLLLTQPQVSATGTAMGTSAEPTLAPALLCKLLSPNCDTCTEGNLLHDPALCKYLLTSEVMLPQPCPWPTVPALDPVCRGFL